MAHSTPSLRDARAVLGVTAAATPEQVATAFRRLARTIHPDVNEAGDAAPRFSALVAAYPVVMRAARAGAGTADTDVEHDPASTHRTDDVGVDVAGADGAESGAETSLEPRRRRSYQVSTGPTGTAVWESGRPLLHVAPAVVRPAPTSWSGHEPTGRPRR